jgi:hypothetical protein
MGVVAIWLLAAATSAQEARIFRAGADRADITPELGTLIVGDLVPRPATHVHDPLFVRTLVLDDGETRLAFVLVDNVGVPRLVCDEAKRLIEQRTRLPKSHVLIAATHTHSAGSARERSDTTESELRDGFTRATPPLSRYQQFLAQRMADSVSVALNRLEPAEIAWGAGRQPEHVFNRRWFVKSEENRRNPFGGVDRVRMNPPANPAELIEPAGPVDPEVAFLAVRAKSGRPIAVLANYSLHYVGGIPPGVIAGDYFGVFDRRLGELLGVNTLATDPAFVGLMSNGTSGNINNIDVRTRRTVLPPYVKMQQVGEAVAAEVHRVYQELAFQPWVKLAARYEELSLRPRQASPELLAYARRTLERPAGEKRWHPSEAVFLRSALRSADAPEHVAVPLQAFRIGALAIAATPVETFVETGLALKAQAPTEKAFTISIANGAFGYLPTLEQHALGGYETWVGVNRLEVDAASKMLARLLAMIGEMQESR